MDRKIIIEYLADQIRELAIQNAKEQKHLSFMGYECGQPRKTFDTFWRGSKNEEHNENTDEYSFLSGFQNLHYQDMSISCRFTPKSEMVYHLRITRSGGRGVAESWSDFHKLEELLITKYGNPIYSQSNWGTNGMYLPQLMKQFDLPNDYECSYGDCIRIYNTELGTVIISQDSKWRFLQIHYIDKSSYEIFKQEHAIIDYESTLVHL